MEKKQNVAELTKINELYDYAESQTTEGGAFLLLTILGLDNSKISKTRTKEEWKKLINKLIKFKKLGGKR